MSVPLSSGWEMKFRLACYERRGEAYQDLFASIMERRDVGFQRVRPWGSSGDRKNDGWLPSRRILFQCYAPSTLSPSALATKLQDDYDGAIEYWNDHFDKWVFVHDDLEGMAPLVAKKIAELNGRSSAVQCTAWGHNELRNEFASLNDSDRVAILGAAIGPSDFTSVDASHLRPLIEALGRMSADPAADVKPVPRHKIEENQLSPFQVEFLKLGSARAPLVDDYLGLAYILPSHTDAIAQAVSNRYQAFRTAGRPPADVFDLMLSWVTGGLSDTTTMANALAILAYFFERCHIFEVPAERST